MLEKLTAAGSSTKPAGAAAATFDAKSIKEQVLTVYTDLLKACEQVETIYEELSARNLNPRTYMFAVWEPVSTKTIRLLSPTKMIFCGLLVLAAVLGLTAGGCLFHAGLKTSRKAPPANPVP